MVAVAYLLNKQTQSNIGIYLEALFQVLVEITLMTSSKLYYQTTESSLQNHRGHNALYYSVRMKLKFMCEVGGGQIYVSHLMVMELKLTETSYKWMPEFGDKGLVVSHLNQYGKTKVEAYHNTPPKQVWT